MNELIKEARELCEKATSGQWKRHDTADYAEIHNGDTWGKDLNPIALVGHIDDANFIARSRTLVEELCDALEKAEAEVERLRETQRWVPVSERLPDEDGYYLCWFDGGIHGIFSSGSITSRELWSDVTHWMQLPGKPKEGE